MKAEIVTHRYIKCPGCGDGRAFYIDGLEAGRSWGPWSCKQRNCRTQISGRITADGAEIEVSESDAPGIALLKLRDLYLVKEEKYGRVEAENADYFYHSHQCPTSLLGDVAEVFTVDGKDVHGLLRFVANIPYTPETWKLIDEEIGSLEALFRVFQTDGTPPPTEWPERDQGVIPWLAELQREYRKGAKE